MITSNEKKIAIIGCAGSGKTTLALQLKDKLNLPLYHLDQYYWKPHWQRAPYEEFYEAHNTLCEQDQWIIEGSYIRVIFPRVFHADVIIFLDLPRYRCMWHVFKRWILNYGKVMPDSPENCPQKLDWEFIQWIWRFNKTKRDIVLHALATFKDEKLIYIFKSLQEVRDFVEKVK